MAKKAVELDYDDAEAHYALGLVYHIDRDFEAAISEYQASVGLNPSLADAHHMLGAALVHSGRPEEALPHLHMAISLSPNDGKIGPFLGRLGMAKFCLQALEEAVQWARKAIRAPHIQWPTHAVLVSALAHLDRMEEAAAELGILQELQPSVSVKFVRTQLPITDQPSLDLLTEGLRKAGVPEE